MRGGEGRGGEGRGGEGGEADITAHEVGGGEGRGGGGWSHTDIAKTFVSLIILLQA